MGLGERVRTRRQDLSMTQEELANYLYATPQHISAIEKDKRSPSLHFLALLAQRLGVSTDFLISGNQPAMPDVTTAIMADENLTIALRRALVTIIESAHESSHKQP